MNQLLFERSTGNLGPNVFARLETTRLLRSFAAAPQFRFDGGERGTKLEDGEVSQAVLGERVDIWAHQAGINSLAIDRFDGRILISGGSDATIRLWDLQQAGNPNNSFTYKPVAQILRSQASQSQPPAAGARPRKSQGHRFGVTHLSFYPFDSAAFLSSSYDQTLKLWDTETTQLSASFELGAKVYTHAISPIAEHLLVACGTQHPAVRLVDLRSGSAVQSLVAPGAVGAATGAVLSAAWSPRHEHVLASGAVDGTVRIWDVRRASGLVALLDQEDSLGIVTRGGTSSSAGGGGGGGSSLQDRGIRLSARAHNGPVNGLAWTDDGAYVVSAGHDRRIRVWDAATGANTLASFGPTIRNGGLASVAMFASPAGLAPPRGEVLFWPNETEILVLDLHDGGVVTRLRGIGPQVSGVRTSAPAQRGRGSGGGGGGVGGERTVRNRVTSIAWRGAGGGGASSGVGMGGANMAGAVYSGHLDGQIRVWAPRLAEGRDDEDADADDVSAEGGLAAEEAGRKRKAVDDAYRSLMGKKITFT